jgi:hypothetical protein
VEFKCPTSLHFFASESSFGGFSAVTEGPSAVVKLLRAILGDLHHLVARRKLPAEPLNLLRWVRLE